MEPVKSDTIELVSKLGIIASTLSSITDLQTLSDSIGVVVDTIVNVRYNGLYLIDLESGKLKMLLAKGFTKEEQQKAEDTAMDRHPGRIYKTQEVLLIHDTEKDGIGKSKDSKRSFRVRSRVWLPILNHGISVGSFGMASIHPNQFSEEHVAILSFVCDMTGVVYNNILLKDAKKKKEKHLRKKNEEFEVLFESNPDSIFIHDFKKITKTNSAFLKHMGYKDLSELNESNFYDLLIHKRDREKGAEILSKEKSKSTLFIPQLRMLKSGGEEFISEVYISAIYIEGRLHKQITIRDITERIKTEEQLKKEEQKTLMLQQAEQLPGIIFQSKISKDGKISYPFSGGQLLDYLSYDSIKDTEKKQGVFGTIYKDDQDKFTESINQSMKSMKDWSMDYRINMSDGSIRWMRGNSTPSEQTDKSIIFHGYITDITDYRLAAEALIDSEHEMSTMFKNAPESVIITDNKGKIQNWNPKAEKTFGWRTEEVAHKDLYKIILPDISEEQKNTVIESLKDRSLTKTTDQSLELIVLNKRGSAFPISLSISEMTIKGSQYYISFISDITKRRQNQEKIQQSLEEKDVLLKEIHHRVKNNMQVITGLLSLQSGFVEQEQIRELFMSSQRRIHSMGIVHEMLYQSEDVSKINLRDYLRELAEGLIKAMKGSDTKVELKMEIPEVSLNLDTAIPLGLITNELLTNSLKYGIRKEGGIIHIRLIKLEYPEFRLELGDNGPGYSERYDYITSKSLGLMLVHRLSRQLGGKAERIFGKPGTNYVIHFREV
jgi:PAS domain S-box-containing protein